ncbi:hypothetical protein KP77_34430 [Jeotgalibacillus alimentarius]|uniref:Uncharacterized protein n=1 Tax=Jeotgalibacillus alimentarius TaxID=135826 RepID=A0A0C2VFM1_9BACL|nr:hypothetical protein [Jeotgalibacillus alimentarius]KIL42813.1 hypothetical protein KP77_34430 [Jeotgalibacillus alimentarius]
MKHLLKSRWKYSWYALLSFTGVAIGMQIAVPGDFYYLSGALAVAVVNFVINTIIVLFKMLINKVKKQETWSEGLCHK